MSSTANSNSNSAIALRVDVLEKQVALLLKPDNKTTNGLVPVVATKKAKPGKKDTLSDDEKPKTKRTTGYLEFSKAMRDDAKSRLSVDGATFKNQDIMTELGSMWKALSDEQRNDWNAQAKSSTVVDAI
jgi:hypothetical protein